MSIQPAIDDVLQFHRAAGQIECTSRPAMRRAVTRWKLLREEIDELIEAQIAGDMVEVADAYADIVYIVLGSAITQIGAERFAEVWAEVHRTNMAKRWPDGTFHIDDNGKVVKPPGWEPPRIAEILEAG